MPPDDDLSDDDLPPLPPSSTPLPTPLPPSSPRPPSSPSRGFALPQTLDEIRDGFRDIATSESTQKEHALSLTRLFHAMEMLLRHECAVRDARIVSLKNDLSRARLEHDLERLSRPYEAVQEEQPAPPPPPAPRRSRKW